MSIPNTDVCFTGTLTYFTSVTGQQTTSTVFTAEGAAGSTYITVNPWAQLTCNQMESASMDNCTTVGKSFVQPIVIQVENGDASELEFMKYVRPSKRKEFLMAKSFVRK